jgi:hypothetical protein
MQAERDKAFNEMHPATMGRAGYWFRDISVPGPDHDPGPMQKLNARPPISRPMPNFTRPS